MFSGVFLGMGGGNATEKILSALNLGPWGVLVLFLFIAYLAGFILDWASILLVFVPIFSPIIDKLGFDPIWFGTLFIMMIQTSYLTPPMAPAIFYLKGIAPPEITTNEMFQGIVAFMFLQLIGIALVVAFPSDCPVAAGEIDSLVVIVCRFSKGRRTELRYRGDEHDDS